MTLVAAVGGATLSKRPRLTKTNTISSSAVGATPLSVEGMAGQTADLLRINKAPGDVNLWRMAPGGSLIHAADSQFTAGYDFYIAGEGNPRANLSWSGFGTQLQFGSGGAALDTFIKRSGNKAIQIGPTLNMSTTDDGTLPGSTLSITTIATGTGAQAGHLNNTNLIQKEEKQVASAANVNLGHTLSLASYYGGFSSPVAAVGTSHVLTISQLIEKSGNNSSEFTPLAVYMANNVGTATGGDGLNPGRMWLTDFIMHGPVGVQPNLLSGFNLLMNNYYNGSPSVTGRSAAMAITSWPGITSGNGTDGQATSPTYPVDIGILVTGGAGDSQASITRNGYNTGIKIGGGGSAWIPSMEGRIGRGIDVGAWITEGMVINNRHSSVAADTGVGLEITNTSASRANRAFKISGSGTWLRYMEVLNSAGTPVWLLETLSGTTRQYVSGFQEFEEITDPAAGSANRARLYIKDNGSGKSQLCVRFPTGAVQVLSTEP